MFSKKPDKKVLKAFKNGLLKFKLSNSIYSIFAEYYDLIMDGIDYKSWYEYLLKINNRYGKNLNKVLDMACGTCNTLFYFIRDGYYCCGLDISKQMLLNAQKKLSKLKNDIKLIQSDMCNFKGNEKYNLIYSLNDSVNYLKDTDSLKNFFYTAYDLLENESILVFDVSTEFNIIKNFSNLIYEEYKNFAFLWNNSYDKKAKLVFSELNFLMYDTLEVIREEHTQRIYSIDEITKEARSAGFFDILVFDGFTFKKPSTKSEILHFVLRKE